MYWFSPKVQIQFLIWGQKSWYSGASMWSRGSEALRGSSPVSRLTRSVRAEPEAAWHGDWDKCQWWPESRGIFTNKFTNPRREAGDHRERSWSGDHESCLLHTRFALGDLCSDKCLPIICQKVTPRNLSKCTLLTVISPSQYQWTVGRQPT